MDQRRVRTGSSFAYRQLRRLSKPILISLPGRRPIVRILKNCPVFLAAFVAAMVPGASAAQLLFEVAPGAPRSAVALASTEDIMGPELEPVAIRLAPALLAAAPERIAIPSLLGGGTEWVQKTGFEEREDGFVWYGGPEGHFPINHSHVVLTEKNGWTVGTYLSGGRWYEIRADSAGAGVVTADSTDEPPHWCGAKPPSAPVMPHLPLGSAASSTRDRWPSSVGSPAYDPLAPPAEIDIVISVSKEAEKYFEKKSSVDAEVQAIVDYASLVLKNSFENNSWFVAPVVRPVAVVGDIFDNIDGLNGEPYELALKHMTRLHALRREHNADIVHIITKSRIYDALGVCGIAPILLRGETAEENVQYAFSITDVNCDQASPGRSKRTFIHEIGHNLGLNHNV